MKTITTDTELRQLQTNGVGLIFNDFSKEGPSGSKYNVLHSASCYWLAKSNTKIPKFFFNSFQEANSWLSSNRGPENVNWKRCGSCKAISTSITPTKIGNKKADSSVKFVGSNKNIFISYRRADSEDITGRLYDRLAQHFGKQAVFKDVDSIPLGVNYKKYIDEQIEKCQIILVVIGKSWANSKDSEGKKRLENTSDLVRLEIESALQKELVLIPVFVQRAEMPNAEELPESLRGLVFYNGVSVRPDPDFHKDIDVLIKGIESHSTQ